MPGLGHAAPGSSTGFPESGGRRRDAETAAAVSLLRASLQEATLRAASKAAAPAPAPAPGGGERRPPPFAGGGSYLRAAGLGLGRDGRRRERPEEQDADEEENEEVDLDDEEEDSFEQAGQDSFEQAGGGFAAGGFAAAAPASSPPRKPSACSVGWPKSSTPSSSGSEYASAGRPGKDLAPLTYSRGRGAGRRQHQLVALQKEEGLLVDSHSLISGVADTACVFKGLLLLFMASSQVLVSLSTPNLLEHAPWGLFLCNSAAVQCVAGMMITFGFSCYGKYFRTWPDAVLRAEPSQVIRTCFFPLVCAWICGFAQRFSRPRAAAAADAGAGGGGGGGGGGGSEGAPRTRVAVALEVGRAIAFEGMTGSGPDILIACTINFLLVFIFWHQICRALGRAKQGPARDAAALGLALAPLLLTQAEVSDCSGHRQWLRHFLPCGEGEGFPGASRGRVGSLAALPHLVHFAAGLLLAACWDRFYGDLRPVGDGGPSGGLHVLPWPAARRWSCRALAVSGVLSVFFVPLGQVWLHADLTSKDVPTPCGRLIRAYPGGPSALWLLGSLWPVAAWAFLAGLLVLLKEMPMIGGGAPLGRLVAELQHLGENMLYYVTFVNVFLAGVVQAYVTAPDDDEDAAGFSTTRCLLVAAGVLAAGRFLFFVAAASK